MALVDKQAAMECCFKPKVTPGGAIFDALKMAIRNEIEALPDVESVPLEPLCEWMSGKCRMEINGLYCRFPAETWKILLKEWMEEKK